jgi:hypothetical protein
VAQSLASIIYRETIGLLVPIPYYLFSGTFSFSTDKSKSLSKYRVPDRDKNYLCRSSQSLYRIRERSLEGLNESDDQRGCISLQIDSMEQGNLFYD